MEQQQQVTNFARFYALFDKMPCSGDREEMKRMLVKQYTFGRTDSLREMTRSEYNGLCQGLERTVDYQPHLKKHRSECLHLMQLLGIDTSDWTRVNAFCQDPRIAGKPFARLRSEELVDLSIKLRAIQSRGGLKPRADPRQQLIPGTEIIAPEAPSNLPRLGEA